jgi:hypothetical protein
VVESRPVSGFSAGATVASMPGGEDTDLKVEKVTEEGRAPANAIEARRARGTPTSISSAT